uniref:Uncharacterized protein n=1 Tax=Setaria italica TaxID=4555 RepID=K3Z204_SETIT
MDYGLFSLTRERAVPHPKVQPILFFPEVQVQVQCSAGFVP